MAPGQWIATWFGVDDEYVRPGQGPERVDWVAVGVLLALTIVNRELNRPLGVLPVGEPIWIEYLVIVTGAVPLLWRRRYPLPVVGYSFLHFFVATQGVPEVGLLLGYQALCFFAIYSAAAWARDRRLGLLVLGAITLALFGWLAWDTAMGSGFDALRSAVADGPDTEPGLLPPITSAVLLSYLVNAIYLFGAIVLGRTAWWQARNSALLRRQAGTIAEQSAELQHRAVVAERLRIARELHDVVAHHVSVMGIQAGAARMLLDSDPDRARESLHVIEEASRTAVAEMRSLLGALRGATGDSEDDSRLPEPTLAELPALLEEFTANGLAVEFTDTAGQEALQEVPLPLQLSLYRIIAEALTNVRRHSTADRARVVLRVSSPPGAWVEVEIVDDGRPLPATSGSGLGQLGIRERIASHGGQAEIGPRPSGGYRVRARLPLCRRQPVEMRHD